MWAVNPSPDPAQAFLLFLKNYDLSPKDYPFAKDLILGTIENLPDIDAKIAKFSQNWAFARIAKVDLAILRIATFELLFRDDIPPIASINEAIDLTKQMSDPDSKRFVNGILDKVASEINRPLRTPKGSDDNAS